MHRLAIVLIVSVCLGCGSRGGIASVSGTVKYKGQPVEGAQVMFTPSKGAGIDASTDADGRFSLQVATGPSQVSVTKMVKKNPDDPYSSAVNVLPARYAIGDTSGLTMEIADGKHTIEFELTD